MQFKKFLRHYWKSITLIAVILYLSFAPPTTFKGIPAFENADKIVHFLMYGTLTIFLIYDFHIDKKRNKNFFSFILVCILLPVLLGGLIEIIQPLYFAPRTGSWTDFLCNIAGVFSGWMAMRYLRKNP